MMSPTDPAIPDSLDKPLTRKERIDIILKEYDSARKELDEEIRFLSTLALSVGLGTAAGIFGLRDQLNISAVFLVVPLVLIVVHTARAHLCWFSRKWSAGVPC